VVWIAGAHQEMSERRRMAARSSPVSLLGSAVEEMAGPQWTKVAAGVPHQEHDLGVEEII
jgi:hypothetical protein